MGQTRDATANLTLGEIKNRDIDNLSLVRKSAKKYFFDHEDKAVEFIVWAFERAAARLGVNLAEVFARYENDPVRWQTEKQRAYRRAGVKVEVRTDRYSGQDAWRNGIYVYYENEIAYFISVAVQARVAKYKTANILVPGTMKWMVITNAPQESEVKPIILTG